MRWLLDSNVWVAAFAARGLCAELTFRAIELHEQGIIAVMVCPTVQEEVLRILARKVGLPQESLTRVQALLARMTTVPEGRWSPPPGFPNPDNVPIVGAALEAGATALVTGDQALLALRAIDGLPVLSPREAFLRLRRLR